MNAYGGLAGSFYVVADSNFTLYGIDATGSISWTFHGCESATSIGGFVTGPMAAVVKCGMYVAALSPSTGSPLWTYNVTSGDDPYSSDNQLIAAGVNVLLLTRKLKSFEWATGMMKWENENSMSSSYKVTFVNGLLLLQGSYEAALSVLDAATGKLLWKASLPSYGSQVKFIGTDSIATSYKNGSLTMVTLMNAFTGATRWTASVAVTVDGIMGCGSILALSQQNTSSWPSSRSIGARDMETGAAYWSTPMAASKDSTSGLVFTGCIGNRVSIFVGKNLTMFDSATGELLAIHPYPFNAQSMVIAHQGFYIIPNPVGFVAVNAITEDAVCYTQLCDGAQATTFATNDNNLVVLAYDNKVAAFRLQH